MLGWDGLTDLLPEQDRGGLIRRIRDHSVEMLLLRYDRAGHEGVLALSTNPLSHGRVDLRAHRTASTTESVVARRAGPQRALLAGTTVAVVGCGAIGSFVVDQLVRAAVGQVSLKDDDVLRPGNLVRHLAGSEQVGMTKAEAVRQVLTGKPYNHTTISTRHGDLHLPNDATSLIEEHHLVIDATADGSATALLHYAAESLGRNILSVCAQNDGATVRVELLPPLDGAQALGESPRHFTTTPEWFEGGCGSPVSPTAPYAVAEAAALASRHACALLVGAPLHPAGEARDNPRVAPTGKHS